MCVLAKSLQYNRLAMLLYYITDRRGFSGTDAEQRSALLRRIAGAARAGVDYIQLREKNLDATDLELLAREAMHVIRESAADTKLLINSSLEVALAVGADGVHLPSNSSPVPVIRDQWLQQSQREPLLGVSAHSLGDIRQAGADGASFVVFAPIFEKAATGAKGIGIEVLAEACATSRTPVLALGGVKLGNARTCLEAGASGIAGIHLFQEGSITGSVDALRWLARHVNRTDR
jgi:thiamine-phosphate pyrophosphorylase